MWDINYHFFVVVVVLLDTQFLWFSVVYIKENYIAPDLLIFQWVLTWYCTHLSAVFIYKQKKRKRKALYIHYNVNGVAIYINMYYIYGS